MKETVLDILEKQERLRGLHQQIRQLQAEAASLGEQIENLSTYVPRDKFVALGGDRVAVVSGQPFPSVQIFEGA